MGKACTGQAGPGLARSGAGKSVPGRGNSMGQGPGAGEDLGAFGEAGEGVLEGREQRGRGQYERG